MNINCNNVPAESQSTAEHAKVQHTWNETFKDNPQSWTSHVRDHCTNNVAHKEHQADRYVAIPRLNISYY